MPPNTTLPVRPPLVRSLRTRSPSERALLRFVAIAAGLAIAVALAQSLVQSADATRAAIARDAAALAEARTRAAEIATLERASAPPATDPKSDLDRVLAQEGLRAAVTQLDWQSGRARLTFADIGFDPLVRLLETLQREAHLRLVDANVTARVESGTVRAELALAR